MCAGRGQDIAPGAAVQYTPPAASSALCHVKELLTHYTSYFPAQKSELHFLIEPSSFRRPALRCSLRRIDELYVWGCCAIQGRIAGVILEIGAVLVTGR